MARHSPEIQAEAAHAIISGELSWTAACEKYGCSKSTLSSWVATAKAALKGPSESQPPTRRSERTGAPRPAPSIASVGEVLSEHDRRRRMRHRLFDLAEKGIEMVMGQAEVAGEREFVREKPEQAIELGRFILGRIDTLVASLGAGIGPVPIPSEPDPPSERVEAELVE